MRTAPVSGAVVELSEAADGSPLAPATTAAPGLTEARERIDLERLLELGVRLSTGLELRPILAATLAAAAEFAAAPAGALWLSKDDGEGLDLGVGLGLDTAALAALQHVPLGLGAVAECWQRRACVVVEDTAVALGEAPIGLCAVHAAPLLDLSGRVLGVLALFWAAPHRLSAAAADLIDRCVRLAAGPIDNAIRHARVRQELAVGRAAAERLALAQRAAGVCTWDWHVDTGAIDWSDALQGMLGLRPDEPTPNECEWLHLIHPDDRAVIVHRRDEVVREGGDFHAEFRVRRSDGAYRWIAARGTAFREPLGAPVRFVGASYDITDRVCVEAALRDSEERYRSLFDSIDEGFCVIEVVFDGDRAVDYRFLEVNPAFEKHTGLRDARGKSMLELAPDHDAHWFAVYGQVAVTGEPVRFVNEATALDRWFDVYAFRLGHGHKVALLFNDITARVRAEADREQLVQRLRDDDRKKDDFIALLAHELRNPLAPIRTGLQVMQRASHDEATVARARAIMDRQLKHLVRLIDDLMDVSRISRNKLELRRARVSLADVIDSAVESARPPIAEAGHELQVSLPAEPLVLDADLTRLAQVFSNLLTNSAKYTPTGGQIRLTAARQGDEVVVSVSDTGTGIPAGSLSSIFDMFSQVDRSLERSTGGLGVGLALVKGLVEMHGGSITAASAGEGQGSTFTVRLPLVRAHAHPVAAAPVRDAQGPRRRVLVVDDNRDGAASMARLLELMGHELRTAHDGIEAIAAAEEFRPEVILMDVGMPRLNGLDATRRIREQPWGQGITIIALTGWGQAADRARSRAAGCDGHLVKPVDLPDLEHLLAAIPTP